jgi:type I pantothenate kinase
MSEREVLKTAEEIWDTINKKNLDEHVLPLKKYANIVYEKHLDHKVKNIIIQEV